MTKRKLVWAALSVALVVSIIGAGWAFFGKHEVTLTQAQIQQAIDAKMPFQTKSGVIVSNVKVNLANNKIALAIEAQTTKLNTTYVIAADTIGTLRYDNFAGSFYFHPDALNLTRAEANGDSVGEKVGNFIDKWIDSKKIVANKAEIMATAEALVRSSVQNSAEFVLARTPVYTLPSDLKGTTVKLLVKDVQVDNGNVVIHLSLWQLTKMVIVWALIALASLGLAVAMMRNPELFLMLPPI